MTNRSKPKTVFQPVVNDETGSIRRDFAALHRRSGMTKSALAARVFSAGMAIVAASGMPAMEAGK